jgi:hypothetical protein
MKDSAKGWKKGWRRAELWLWTKAIISIILVEKSLMSLSGETAPLDHHAERGSTRRMVAIEIRVDVDQNLDVPPGLSDTSRNAVTARENSHAGDCFAREEASQ